MNKLPNDPLLLDLSREELLFTAYFKHKYMDDMFNTLGLMLGTRWTPEAVHGSGSNNKKKKEIAKHYDFPLALLLNPRVGKSMLEKVVPVPKKQGSGAEFEEALNGRNLIREHQERLLRNKKLMDQATQMLNKDKT